MKYVFIADKETNRFGFKDDKDCEILETDIQISNEIFDRFFKEERTKDFKLKNINATTFEDMFEQINVLSPEQIFENLKQDKIRELNNICNETISKGFYSSALGEEHFYRFNIEEDQINFNQQLSMIQEFPDDFPIVYWKTEDAGVLSHTQEQFKLVVKDASLHKNSNIQKYWNLKAQVQAASSIEEVQAIAW